MTNPDTLTAETPTIEELAVQRLVFDPLNPRLPARLLSRDEPAVLAWMLEDATLIELMGSIGEQGYFPGEPLLAVRNPKNDDEYVVVEGNRRLAAVKLLLDPERAPIRKNAVAQAASEARHRPIHLPTIVYPKRAEILQYLSYRHITGIRPWSPLAKAKYLHQLLQSLNGNRPTAETFRTLARTIGSRSDYVAQLLTGYALYSTIVSEDFFNIPGLGEDSIQFSLITTALSYNSIAHFLGLRSDNDPSLRRLNMAHLQELTAWMFERQPDGTTRLGESRNLHELSSVVANPKALEAFRRGEPLGEASLRTEIPAQLYRNAVSEAKGRLRIARDHVHQVTDLSQADADDLQEVVQIGRNLRVVVVEALADLGSE